MASAGREPITGAWGQSSHEVQGQSPWLGARKAKPPPEAEDFSGLRRRKEAANLFWELELA